jgi:hypothetical protein
MNAPRSGGGRLRKRANGVNRQARKFTRAEERRIRARILARGMAFRIFLPEDTSPTGCEERSGRVISKTRRKQHL